MNFSVISPLFPEKKGFSLSRQSIGDASIICHFLTPVTVFLGQTETKVKAGGCIIWEPHSSQHFKSPDCALLHNWLHSDSTIEPIIKKYGLDFQTVYYPPDTDEITRIFQQMNIEITKKAKFHREALDALAETLFISLARASNDSNGFSISAQQKEAFLALRTRIHMNIEKSWTIEKMAVEVNLSPSRFFSVYRSFFGISPQKDLINRRIQVARELLRRQELTISEVAELTGYTNHYHFIRQFKQVTKMTPGQFKKL